MSTFEKVKRNILRDMDKSMTHTAESWARIMLDNTSRLTRVSEQKKFWAWMTNPEEDESIVDPVCEQFTEHCRIDEVDQYDVPMTIVDTDDEKSSIETVQMKNEYFRNGLGMYIKSKPINTNSSRLEPSPVDPMLLDEQKVE